MVNDDKSFWCSAGILQENPDYSPVILVDFKEEYKLNGLQIQGVKEYSRYGFPSFQVFYYVSEFVALRINNPVSGIIKVNISFVYE